MTETLRPFVTFEIFCADVPGDPPARSFHIRPQRSQRFNQPVSLSPSGEIRLAEYRRFILQLLNSLVNLR
jgi:hypothetical protein